MRRYPDRSSQYVRTYDRGQQPAEVTSEVSVARAGTNGAPWAQPVQSQYANTSSGYDDRDPGAIFRQFAR